MEPYYTKAEQLYQVHGARGEDPTEPPYSVPYPFPAVSHESRIQQLSDDLQKAGYHPFHAPCGVMLDARLSAEIQQIFLDHRQVYGSLHVHAVLKARGIHIPWAIILKMTLFKRTGIVHAGNSPALLTVKQSLSYH